MFAYRKLVLPASVSCHDPGHALPGSRKNIKIARRVREATAARVSPTLKTFLDIREQFGGQLASWSRPGRKRGTSSLRSSSRSSRKSRMRSFSLPGANKSTVQSLYTPNVRFTELTDRGGRICGRQCDPRSVFNLPQWLVIAPRDTPQGRNRGAPRGERVSQPPW